MLDLEFVIRKLVTMIWELRLANEPSMADDLLDVLVKICTEEANRGAKKNEPSDSIGWTGKGKENAPSYYGQPINYCCHESMNGDDWGDMKNPLYLYHCKECGLYSLRRAVFPEMEECRNCGYKSMDFVMKRGGGYHDDVYDYVEKRGGKIF